LRVFRVYRETPPHYHAGSDEHLYVLSGRGTFWMGDPSNCGEFEPGDFLFFKRNVVHAQPTILEGPVVGSLPLPRYGHRISQSHGDAIDAAIRDAGVECYDCEKHPDD
jgi:hypothetical protein